MWFFFSVTLCPSTGWGVSGQAKQAVVNEVWKRGEIVMCIAVPDTSILAESNQLIKFCPLVTHRLRPKSKN